MRAVLGRGWRRRVLLGSGLGLAILLAGHPLARAGSDVWSNVGPGSPLGSEGVLGRYPLSHYTLDQHFSAVTASLTGGVDVSGVPPMIAYFLASVLWTLTSFLASLLISLFGFAFSLDLLNGSQATGGAGALAPVSAAIHSIYADVFGAPWLVLAVAVVGMWAMWKALVQRRYSETAGALALSLIYVVIALFFVAQPGKTIGQASEWTNQMSQAFLSISDHGTPSGGAGATEEDSQQLFEALVFKPWVVLDFGGLEHCVLSGTGSENSDPDSAPVRPLSSSPSRDAELSRRLSTGTEVSADGKVCVNNANKYGSHFLHFGLGTDERNEEYEALNHGDSSKLPEADTEQAGYRLGVADKPATDAMEEGGQYQRLLIAILVFAGELGAFMLLGALSGGVILAQVLLLLLLAFAPVALVAAAIPGRGHDFFKGWLEKLAGFLLRKAAYSLILAILLAVNGALTGAIAELGWLMSFALQGFFFWAVFLQRKTLTDSLIGIATGPRAPGHEGTLKLLALYGGARAAARPLGGRRRGARAAGTGPRRLGGGSRRRNGEGGTATAASLAPSRVPIDPKSAGSAKPRAGVKTRTERTDGTPTEPRSRAAAPDSTPKDRTDPRPARAAGSGTTIAKDVTAPGSGASRPERRGTSPEEPPEPRAGVAAKGRPKRRRLRRQGAPAGRKPTARGGSAGPGPCGEGNRAAEPRKGAPSSVREHKRLADAPRPQVGAAHRLSEKDQGTGLAEELRIEREEAVEAKGKAPASGMAPLPPRGSDPKTEDSAPPISPPHRRRRRWRGGDR